MANTLTLTLDTTTDPALQKLTLAVHYDSPTAAVFGGLSVYEGFLSAGPYPGTQAPDGTESVTDYTVVYDLPNPLPNGVLPGTAAFEAAVVGLDPLRFGLPVSDGAVTTDAGAAGTTPAGAGQVVVQTGNPGLPVAKLFQVDFTGGDALTPQYRWEGPDGTALTDWAGGYVAVGHGTGSYTVLSAPPPPPCRMIVWDGVGPTPTTPPDPATGEVKVECVNPAATPDDVSLQVVQPVSVQTQRET